MKGLRLVVLVAILMIAGNLVAETINVPSDYVMIQEAINASADGDTVLVQPGTYYENNIVFNNKEIILASLFYTTQDTSYISQTIIDGNQNGRCLYLFESNIVISGLVIQNGRIEDNGTGIHIEDCENVIIENCLIKDNNFETYNSNGAGVYCDNSTILIEDSQIMNNSASQGGGGAYIQYSDTTIRSSEFINNSSGANGGGLYIKLSSNVDIQDCVFSGNTCGDSSDGGGAFLYHSLSYLENNLFSNNTAGYFGGGLHVNGENPVVYHIEVNNCIFEYNNSINCGGGGMNIARYSFLIRNSLFHHNYSGITAGNGGALNTWQTTESAIINTTMSHNGPYLATDPSSTISMFFSERLLLLNCIIVFNETGRSIGSSEEENVEVYNSTIYGHDSNWTAGTLDQGGNIEVDPQFVDADNDHYQLSDNSPCIDAGIDFLTWYEEDYEIPLYYGDAPDMGYCEYEPANSNSEEIVEITSNLLGNYPNPFNPSTTINYNVLEDGIKVELTIFNAKGREVKTLVNGIIDIGLHEVIWNGDDENGNSVASGVYLYKMKHGGRYTSTKKMILLK